MGILDSAVNGIRIEEESEQWIGWMGMMEGLHCRVCRKRALSEEL